MSKYKFLFLPIETKVRELDAKVLLALEAVKRGYAVIIGSKSMGHLVSNLPGGVFFYKDSSAPMKGQFNRLRSNGQIIAVHDEEGFIQFNDENYINQRLRFETIKEVDIYFCWGRHQGCLVSKIAKEFSADTKVVVTGHPRIDLLRDPICQYEVPLKRRKPTILVNTKLAEFNHRKGKGAWIEIMDSHQMIRNNSERNLLQEQVNYKQNLFNEYVLLIEELSLSYPHYDIIVRPHPSEDETVWEKKVMHLPNVSVETTQSVGFWIKQANIVIHTGCTTAIEALILGKPSITFKPLNDSRFDVPLPDSISIEAKNSKEVTKIIDSIHNEEYDIDKYLEDANNRLLPYLSNITGRYAYQQILDEIDQLPLNKYSLTSIPWPYLFIRRIIETIFVIKNTDKKDMSKDIHLSEITDLIERFSCSLDTYGPIKIKSLGSSVYLLYSE